MKKVMFMLVMALSITVSASNEPVTKKVDVDNSRVEWVGKKVTGSHNGVINLESGELKFDGDQLVGGMFTIDMTSINTLDLSGGGKAKLEGHLKSDDFFGVEAHPTAVFNITKVVSRGTPGEYKVIGDVTIKGKTKEIRFLATVKDGMAKADITIDRTDFNVRYGSGSFFDNLGDKTIYDDFSVSVALKY